MRPPAGRTIRKALTEGYGIDVAEIALEGDGADAAAYAWRLTARDGRRLFLKLRPDVRTAAILVPRHLRTVGLAEVVAAHSTTSGEAWLQIDGWTAVVMDLVDGPTAFRAGLDAAGWRALGAFAARLHATGLPDELAAIVPVEDFRPKATDNAREIDVRIDRLEPARLDEHASAVRARWLAERGTIRRIVELADDLGTRIRQRPRRPPFVLSHADFHAANVLVDGRGIHVVDWDEVVFAPRERDLMFVRGSVVAGVVTDAAADAFESAYGRVEIDRELLAWYRLDWAVQDVAGFASEVLFDPDRKPSTRPRARGLFEDLFAPDDEVEGALRLAAELG